jgi:hypothetical protein
MATRAGPVVGGYLATRLARDGLRRSRRGLACFFERYFEPARAPVWALGAPAPRILPQGSVAGFCAGTLLMADL